jgi:ribosomal protein S18 acetylase RimI-like enzyme
MSAETIVIRHADELDLDAIIGIDEKLSGQYRPDVWERRLTYYLRRDPDACLVAEADGKIAGFMLGEVRSGEFGHDEPTGWVEVVGVDPEFRGRSIGSQLAQRLFEHFRGEGAKVVRTLVDNDREDLAAYFASLGFEAASWRPLVRTL